MHESKIDLSMEVEQLLKNYTESELLKPILGRLKDTLSPNLFYHSYAHTLDVLHETLLFACSDSLPPRDIELLAIAAVFHDAGYLVRTEDNESIGAEMARQALRNNTAFSGTEVQIVETLIMDTKLIFTDKCPMQGATTIELSKYLLDADLSNLGRVDFFEKLELQRREINADPKTFLLDTLSFAENHTWLTGIAHKLRQEQKQKNIKLLKERIKN